MIEISDALRWLNHFDRSHLNGINHRLVVAAHNLRANDAAIQDLVRAALQQARTSSQDGLDYCETLLNCAVIEFDRGFNEQARDHLAAAISNYVQGKDVHGAAVASWMLGIAELAIANTDATYTSWKRSLRTFERFRDTNRHILSTRKWYTDTVIKMNQDLVTLPQESFTWINLFNASRLSASNHDLVKILNDNIKGGNHNEVNRIVTVLKERAKTPSDPLECGEVFAETGLARFRMREWLLAIQDLKAAVIKYPAESHQQESVRWLLGAVQFWSENHRVEAVTNWKKSMDGFTKLAEKADKNNRATQKRWYRDRIAYMKAALNGKIRECFS